MSTTPSEDPGVRVTVDNDARTATVALSSECRAESLTPEVIIQLLQQEEEEVAVTNDVKARVAALVAEFRAAPGPCEGVVAESEAPTHGTDGDLQWEPECDPTADRSQTDRSKNTPVDFYSHSAHVCVTAGQHVATRRTPTEGRGGRDVRGNTIPARPGQAVNVDTDQTLSVDDDGKVIAQIDGLLQYAQDLLSISPVLDISGFVDFSSGNIDFEGSVIVREGVRDRFEVKASGDIDVNGLVESSTLICGGNLLCQCGMAAKERGEILVMGNADVGFLNDVRGRVDGDLIVRRELMNCDLVVGGNLICERGAVIGGIVTVTGSLEATVLGSEAEITTVLVLGSVPLITAQLRELKSSCDEWTKALEPLEFEQNQLTPRRASLGPELQKRLEELDCQISDLNTRLGEAESKRGELELLAETSRRIDLLVGDIVHPKVCFRIGDEDYIVTQPLKGPMRIGWDNKRRLVYREDQGHAWPLKKVTRPVPRAA